MFYEQLLITPADPKSAKKTDSVTAGIKASRKMMANSRNRPHEWPYFFYRGPNLNTGGSRYIREIKTPKIDSHIMNSHIKRPRITVN